MCGIEKDNRGAMEHDRNINQLEDERNHPKVYQKTESRKATNQELKDEGKKLSKPQKT